MNLANLHINALDGLLVLGLLFGMGLGFFQGLFRQAASLVALYVATILAAQYYTFIGRQLSFLLSSPRAISQALAFLIILIGANAALSWVNYDAYARLRPSIWPFVDRLGGVLFGFAVAVLWIILILLTLDHALQIPWMGHEPTRQALLSSLGSSSLVPFLRQLSPLLVSALRFWLPRGVPNILLFD